MSKYPDTDHQPFPILIGDIGGTNARFWILLDAYAEPKPFPDLLTADFASIEDAIQQGVLDKTSVQPRSAILAVAGPIHAQEVQLTNCHWVIRPGEMRTNLGLEDIVIINDFEAQALAVAALSDDYRETIGTTGAVAPASRVVLGPGTGLGVAGLVHVQRRWIPVSGEGGHVDLGPRTERDFAVFPHLDRIEGIISAEQVL